MDYLDRAVHIDAISFTAGERGQGNVLRREEVDFIKPAQLPENICLDEKGSAGYVGGAENLVKYWILSIGVVNGFSMYMPLLHDVISCRIVRPSAKLQRAVGIKQLWSDDRCFRGKFAEIGNKLADNIHVHLGVVVDNEAEIPLYCLECDVVVLRKASDFIALDESHPWKGGLGLGEVVRGKAVRDNNGFIVYILRICPD